MEAQDVFERLLEPAGIDNPYPLYAAVHQLGEVIPAGDGLIPGGGQVLLVPAYEVANAVLVLARAT